MTNQKIRVLQIIKSLGRGGAEMLLPETLKLHDKEHFEFHYIYFLPWKDQMVESIRSADGKVTCIPASNNISLMLRVNSVVKYIRENNIALIHAHLPWAGIVARLAGKVTGVPVIYTEHNKQERYHGATRVMNLATMNWLRTVVAVSDDVAKSVKKHKPGLQSRLQVILNGVNTEHFSPGIVSGDPVREQFDIPLGAPVIGTIAVFRFQKRLEVWLELAKKIHAKLPEARFIIVGDGPLKEQLHAKAAELKLDGVVHFAGLQTEVRPYLAAFDLYMMTSIFEGLPIALLEAMASGCPVITTNAGGIGEVIVDGENGILCSVETPELLAYAAFKLLSQTESRQKLGVSARQTICERFSMNKMVSELETLYKSELARGM